MENKEFYERILVAKCLQIEMTAATEGEPTLRDAFYYVQAAGDQDTMEYIWFSTVGDYVTWVNHLEYVCFQALGLKMQQPGYSPFMVDLSRIELDKKYLNWYYSEWVYYISNLVDKYRYLWEPRFKAKTIRGAVDIVDIINKDIAPYIS